MTRSRTITVSLPPNLIDRLDHATLCADTNRSQFTAGALESYLDSIGAMPVNPTTSQTAKIRDWASHQWDGKVPSKGAIPTRIVAAYNDAVARAAARRKRTR